MNIVINLQLATGVPNYMQKIVIRDYLLPLITLQTGHHFFLITTNPEYQQLSLNNTTLVDAVPASTNRVSWQFWYAYRLPRLLKKYHADIFLNLASNSSLKTNLPQVLLMPQHSLLPQTRFQQKKNIVSFNKASVLVLAALTQKNNWCSQYQLAEDKVAVAYTGATAIFTAAHFPAKENTKEKYTSGREYFFFSGELSTQNNLINLLKAFSFFKKRQKSNMQLVINTPAYLPANSIIASLKTYKYREEVVVLTAVGEAEQARLTAAAYALVYVPTQNDDYLPVLQAMQCEVPVITCTNPVMQEICGEAALFADPAVFENIADKMMLLFKDEDKRSQLIEKGKIQVQQFTAAATVDALWRVIVKCVEH